MYARFRRFKSLTVILMLTGSIGFSVAGCEHLEPSTAVTSAGTPSTAPAPPINVDNHHLALGGYDPVSYFVDLKPVPGLESVTTTHDGAVYRFSTEAHRKLFVAEPDRYLPKYGGFCATGVAHGYKVSCDPTSYRVQDGKLYLFNKTLFLDASSQWDEKSKGMADLNWHRATIPSTQPRGQ